MSYSKAYQTIIAGVVREDEQILMFGNNEIATPGRVTGFHAIGGKVYPAIDSVPLDDQQVGKGTGRASGLNVDGGMPYNS